MEYVDETEQQTGEVTLRRATRSQHDSVLGGVCAGLAEHLGIPVLWVRGIAIALAFASGFGVVLYGALWAFMPTETTFITDTPGGESATRGNRRPSKPTTPATSKSNWTGSAVAAASTPALIALGIGAVLVLDLAVGLPSGVWPFVLAAIGGALIWRQADLAQGERWSDAGAASSPLRLVIGRGWRSGVRVLTGVTLILVATLIFAASNSSVPGLIGTVLLLVVASVVVVAPLLVRLASDLSAEREERVRSQERADVAAHLHDSVLQTLALIQKNSTDAAAVAKLARAQERDLRTWLYSGHEVGFESIESALMSVSAEVEDTHGISIDVVVVGNAPCEESAMPLIAAAREAMVNAAKHAEVAKVSVFAEVTADEIEIFVRDRGVGFDLAAIAEDRKGISESIRGRMDRHGGRAEITSAPGEGTNVKLSMKRTVGQASERVTEHDTAGDSDEGVNQ